MSWLCPYRRALAALRLEDCSSHGPAPVAPVSDGSSRMRSDSGGPLRRVCGEFGAKDRVGDQAGRSRAAPVASVKGEVDESPRVGRSAPL